MEIKTKQELEELVSNNLGLVHSIANKFRSRGIEYDDLFSAGCLGLVKALKAFEPERGVRLSTYAVPVIMGEIKRLFREGGSIKVSRSLREQAIKILREKNNYYTKYGKEPTISELAEITSLTTEEITEAIGTLQPSLSLTLINDDTEFEEADIKVESIEEEITDILSLNQAIKLLDENDRRLIVLRYFKNLTQTQTAEILGTSQVWVSRREQKILQKIRLHLTG